jgi:hypothetical protein
MSKPADWKNYDDFAAGIDHNRLPSTDALVGESFLITLKSSITLELMFESANRIRWSSPDESGEDWYEAIKVGENVYFIDITFESKPREALTLIVNTSTRHVLSIRCIVREEKVEGEPQVAQDFQTGVLGDPDIPPTGPEPAPTRDLIGLRAFYRYSPNHLYEHIYLSSERYGWQCLVGEQRGHGDTDLATTYKFDENQYIFTFREFIIPVASVFFYNWNDMRSTGKFLGVTSAGKIENNPAGAFIQKASMTFYDKEWEPV